MAEAVELKKEVAALADEDLQKRHAALFDDGQGENARRVYVNYSRGRGYHPSEMYILCGNSLLERYRNMVKRLEELVDEYRLANKYLLGAARRLNGGNVVLPPNKIILQRGARFQELIRQKFGNMEQAPKRARDALGITPPEFRNLAAGANLTDGFLEFLEELPDYAPPSLSKRKSRQERVGSKRYREIERIMADVPKPKKNSRLKSDMTKDELMRIGELAFGSNWQPEIARLIEYSEWNLKSCLDGPDGRSIKQPTGEYLRKLGQRLHDQGRSWAPSLPSVSKS